MLYNQSKLNLSNIDRKFHTIQVNKKCFSFTGLIMLAVAGVVVIVAVLTIKDRLRVTSVQKAARMVGAELRFARTYAVSHTCYVAILMPTAQDTHHGGVDDPQYKARALRLCRIGDQPRYHFSGRNYRAKFDSYIDGKNWQFLPDETYIGYSDTHGEFQNDELNNRCNVISGIPFPDRLSALAIDNMRAIIFTPTGSAMQAPQAANPQGGDIHILIHSGVIRNRNELWPVSNDTRPVTITIRELTGRIRYE